jgi:hypothetical protein
MLKETFYNLVDLDAKLDHTMFDNISITACTNEACEVLEGMTKKGQGVLTVENVLTIYKFLSLVPTRKEGLKVNTTKGLKKHPTAANAVSKSHAMTLIVDEANYITEDFLAVTKEWYPHVSFIFVGSEHQLGLSDTGESYIYNQGYLSYELTSRYRAENHAVQAIYDQVEADVANKEVTELKSSEIRYKDNADWWSTIREAIELDLNFIVLAYTNNRVADLATKVREAKGLQGLWDNTSERIQILKKPLGSMEPKYGVESIIQEVFTEEYPHLLVKDHEYNRQIKVITPKSVADYNTALHSGRKNVALVASVGEALTVHKSQGHSFDYVFIDLHDMGKARSSEVYRRLRNVAFSRARKRMFVLV